MGNTGLMVFRRQWRARPQQGMERLDDTAAVERLDDTAADRQKGQTDDSYSSQARRADDGFQWQMALVFSREKCSLLPQLGTDVIQP